MTYTMAKVCRYCLGTETEVSILKGHSFCRPCYRIINKDQYQKHIETRRSYDRSRGSGWDRSGRDQWKVPEAHTYDSYLQRNYGITLEDYEKLWKAQGHVCAICLQECNRSNSTRLCVDHCHKTGRVRGLLCFNCNVGLGKFKDDPELLQAALIYLEK